jgi:hypothetical protein
MFEKQKNASFNEVLSTLPSHGFEVSDAKHPPKAVLASKGGVAAVLVPSASGGMAYAVHPGILVKGEVARLVDRGYQKFLTTSDVELPATASQLQAIHHFSEELTQLTGGISLYNESLGTTSDLYLYDRLKGHEAARPRPTQPWELSDGH